MFYLMDDFFGELRKTLHSTYLQRGFTDPSQFSLMKDASRLHNSTRQSELNVLILNDNDLSNCL